MKLIIFSGNPNISVNIFQSSFFWTYHFFGLIIFGLIIFEVIIFLDLSFLDLSVFWTYHFCSYQFFGLIIFCSHQFFGLIIFQTKSSSFQWRYHSFWSCNSKTLDFFPKNWFWFNLNSLDSSFYNSIWSESLFNFFSKFAFFKKKATPVVNLNFKHNQFDFFSIRS